MQYADFDETKIQSLEISQTAISDESIIGTCELGTAEIKLLNDDNEYSNFKNKWIKTTQGSFYIHNVEPVQEKVNIKLSCYDIKYLLDVTYNQKEYEDLFPCTIAAWRNKIAEKYKIKFNDNNDFPFANLILDKHPYVGKNISVRDVMKQISQACVSFIKTDENDLFYFSWFNSSNPIFIEDWLELTTEKDQTQPVNEVVLGRGDVQDLVIYPNPAPINAKELRIDNNYILDPQDTTASKDKRNDLIETIYNRVSGFSYIIFTMRTQSCKNPFEVKLGSKIKYVDIWGNELESIVMSKTLNWLGGDLDNPENYELTISAEEIRETSSEYKLASPMKKIDEISIKVDKNAKKIEGLITQQDETSSKVVTLEANVDGITTRIEETETKIDDLQIGGTNLLLDSSKKALNSNYKIASYNLSEKPVVGNKYTISLKGTLGEGKGSFRVFNSGGTVHLATLKYDEIQQIYKATFIWKNTSGDKVADDTYINIYAFPKDITTESSIEWVKLEEGDKNTSWSPAPKDTTTQMTNLIQQKVDNGEIATTSDLTKAIKDYNTSEELKSTIKQKITDDELINSSTLSKTIKDLQIGSANLIGIDNVINYDTSTKIDHINFSKNGKVIFSRSDVKLGGLTLDKDIQYEDNIEYILSFKLKVTSSDTDPKLRFWNGRNFANAKLIIDGKVEYKIDSNLGISWFTDNQFHDVEFRFTGNSAYNSSTNKNQRTLIQPLYNVEIVYNAEAEYLQLEKGNKRTDWKPSFSDYSTTTQMTAEIISKIGDNNSTIYQQVSNTYIAKSGNLKTATDIVNSANNTTDTKLKQYSTTAQMETYVEGIEGGINLSVDQKIENIQIGGTNYISNDDSKWVKGNWSIPNVGDKTTIMSNYSDRISLKEKIEIDPNTDYWIKIYSTKDASALFRVCDNNDNFIRSDINLKNRKWRSGANDKYLHLTIYGNSAVSDITNGITRIKLEKGTKATDYSPAPQDMATNSEVKAELELKVGKDDNDQVVSMLNASADKIHIKGNRFILEADNVSISENGRLICTDAKLIGGILELEDTGTEESASIKIKNKNTSNYTYYSADGIQADLTSEYDFTEEDITKLSNYLYNPNTITSAVLKRYDLNKDGKLNAVDLLILSKYINSGISKTKPGKFILNTDSIKDQLQLLNGNGENIISIGLNGFSGKRWNEILNKISGEHVLWSGALYMNQNQTVKLCEKVSEQSKGIVLVFSPYDDSKALDYNYVSHFVPKSIIKDGTADGEVVGMCLSMTEVLFYKPSTKYLYIYDDKIVGDARNVQSGTQSGISYENKHWVLRFVYGI